jgi:hypothetical protein
MNVDDLTGYNLAQVLHEMPMSMNQLFYEGNTES